MKKFLFAASAVTAMFLISCNGDKNNTDNTTDSSSTISDSANRTMDNTDVKMNKDTAMNSNASNKAVTAQDVKDFVQKASSGNMMEVDMGKMAGDNAKSQRVKDFGAMLVTDHSAAGDELKGMAMSNSIMVPTEMMPANKADMDKIMNMKGAGFDKAFMDMMVMDHKKDIAEYQKASTGLSDASYKAFASKTLPTLQKHLDSAMAIQKGMK